jgi:hypothetical protein
MKEKVDFMQREMNPEATAWRARSINFVGREV